jgi:hypothetical protein
VSQNPCHPAKGEDFCHRAPETGLHDDLKDLDYAAGSPRRPGGLSFRTLGNRPAGDSGIQERRLKGHRQADDRFTAFHPGISCFSVKKAADE